MIRIKATSRTGAVAFLCRADDGTWRASLDDGAPCSFTYAGIKLDHEKVCAHALQNATTTDELMAVIDEHARRYISGPLAGQTVCRYQVMVPLHHAPAEAPELRDAVTEMLGLMEDALMSHVYQDGDPVPANCGFVASIQRVRAALGLAPAVIETAPVWSYSANYCAYATGEQESFEVEVCCKTDEDALRLGRKVLDILHSDATKVDARVVQVAK